VLIAVSLSSLGVLVMLLVAVECLIRRGWKEFSKIRYTVFVKGLNKTVGKNFGVSVSDKFFSGLPHIIMG